MISKIMFFLAILTLGYSIYWMYETSFQTEPIIMGIVSLGTVIGFFAVSGSSSQSIVVKGSGNRSSQTVRGDKNEENKQVMKVNGDDNETQQETS